MKNLLSTTFCLASILLIFNSCTHYYYAPNMHNVPLFQEEKEMRIAVAKSGGDEFKGVEFQGAYSFTKNFGVMANGFFVNTQEGGEYGKGKLVELGAGYFKPLNKYFVFETYGGFGWGKAENQYAPGFTSTANFERYFIQPAIGFTSNWFDVAISSRICGLYYDKVDHNISSNSYEIEDLDYIEDHTSSYLFEPALTVRGGWKYVKVQLQLGYSHNLNNPELQQEKLNANIGLYFSLSDKYREKFN